MSADCVGASARACIVHILQYLRCLRSHNVLC